MGAEVGGFITIASDDTDVYLVSGGTINRIERFLLRVDFLDRQFASHTPLTSKIADMRDVLVSAKAVWFVNARNFEFLHLNFLSHWVSSCALPPASLERPCIRNVC